MNHQYRSGMKPQFSRTAWRPFRYPTALTYMAALLLASLCLCATARAQRARTEAVQLHGMSAILATVPQNAPLMSVRVSPDGRHCAYFVVQDKQFAMVIDGRQGPWFDDLDFALFSPDSRHSCYRAKRLEKWCVVSDSVPGTFYSDAVLPAYSPSSGHLVYVAKKGAQLVVVVDGVESKPVDDLGIPVFSTKGGHFAYSAKIGSRSYICKDGQLAGPYDAAGTPSFSPDGSHFAYYVRAGQSFSAIIDGTKVGDYDGVTDQPVVWSNTGARYAFGASHGSKWVLIIDGKPTKEVDGLMGSIAFSEQNRIAYTLRTGATCEVYMEDRLVGTAAGVGAAPFVFLPDGRGLGYVKSARNSEWLVVEGDKEFGPYRGIVDGCFTWSPDLKAIVYAASTAGGMAVFSHGVRISSNFEYSIHPGMIVDASGRSRALKFNNGGRSLSNEEIAERFKRGEYLPGDGRDTLLGGIDFFWIDGHEFSAASTTTTVLPMKYDSSSTLFDVRVDGRQVFRTAYKLAAE